MYADIRSGIAAKGIDTRPGRFDRYLLGAFARIYVERIGSSFAGARRDMRIKSRIERLERREVFDANGPIPLAVFDRVIASTISEAEFDRWFPAFERITASVEAAETRELGVG